jgi:hypothetical protein
MAKSGAARINVPVSDKLKVVCRPRDQVELSAGTRRSNVAGAYASRGAVAGRIFLDEGGRLHDRHHLERVCHSVEEGGRS